MSIGGIGRGKAIAQPASESFNSSNQQNGFSDGFNSRSNTGGDNSNSGFASNKQSGFGDRSGFGGSASGFGGSSGGSFGGERQGSGGGDRACRICNQEGHFARECPQKGGGGGGRGACFKCGEQGHRSAECPQSGGGYGNRGQSFGGGNGFEAQKGFGDSTQDGGAENCNSGFGGGGGLGRGKPVNANATSSDASGGEFGFGSGGGGARFGSNSGGGGGGFGFGGETGFGSGGGGRSGDNACHKCGQEGHFSRDCPQGGGGDNKCRKCGEEGHFARDCPSGGGGAGEGCRRCKDPGHMVRDCPMPMTCFNCNQEGHQSKDCQNPRAERPLAEGQKPPQTYQPKEISEEELCSIERIHTGINFERYDDVKVQVTGPGEGTTPMQSFDEAGFTETILANVMKANFTKPTPIQKRAIPIIMAGHDLMACAQTGSGKTAAFLLPVLTCMIKRGELSTAATEVQEPSAIIITPTRELAIQISTEAKFFSKGTIVKVCLLYGGTNVRYQTEQIKRGCNVLVATPGRLNHFITSGNIGLSKCRYIILDEADRMLDMGFESEIRKVIDGSNMPLKSDRQTLMFSATFPEEIQKLAQDFLKSSFAFIAVGIVGGANSDITQEVEQVNQFEKKERLVELLRLDLQNSVPNADGKYAKKTLVFVERKRVADFTATYLSEVEFKATSIHGDREQQQREEALNDFKSGRCPVLVATAVAARGLDIVGVDHVINYDMPSSIDDYVHRIGRTGRVGNPGRATSFFDANIDIPLASQLVQILADAQQTVPDWLQSYVGGVQGLSTDRPMFGGRDARTTNGGWNDGSGAPDKWE